MSDFFLPTMSRQIGSLNRSLSYPSNHQPHSSRISLSDLTSSPLPSFTTNSPRMDSDDSTHTVFNTISRLDNSDIDNPDDFKNSKPSPSIFSQTSFFPTQPPDESSPAPSSYTRANPTIFPMNSDQPDPQAPSLKH